MADNHFSYTVDISVTVGVRCDARLYLYYVDGSTGFERSAYADSYKCDGEPRHNTEKLLQFEEVTHNFHLEFPSPIYIDRSLSYIRFGYIGASGSFSTMVTTMTKTLEELEIELPADLDSK